MANSLTKITTKSILDGTIANADIADNAITGAKLNADSVSTSDINDDAVTEDKLANAINTSIAGKAVLTGSTNNQITTVTGANAIQGEANLTFDGSTLDCTGNLRVDISSTGTPGAGSAEGIFLRNTNETDGNAVTIFGGADDYSAAASAINFINIDHSANAGAISFDTRTTGNSYAERLRIDSSGRVLLGTTTLGHGNADELTVHNSGNCGITIRSGSSNDGNIFFADADSDTIGTLKYDHTNNAFRINTNGAERLRVLDGGGLTFNGDTAAANALDDYEEGTFTAAFRVEGQSSNVSTDTQEGKYTKIGNTCTLWIYVVLDGAPSGTGSANAWEIRNLPFTSVSDTDHQAIGNARCHNLNNGDYGSDIQMIPRIWNNTTVGRLEAYDQSDYTIRNASTYMQDNTGAMITITYCCA